MKKTIAGLFILSCSLFAQNQIYIDKINNKGIAETSSIEVKLSSNKLTASEAKSLAAILDSAEKTYGGADVILLIEEKEKTNPYVYFEPNCKNLRLGAGSITTLKCAFIRTKDTPGGSHLRVLSVDDKWEEWKLFRKMDMRNEHGYWIDETNTFIIVDDVATLNKIQATRDSKKPIIAYAKSGDDTQRYMYKNNIWFQF
jgi:hypothetical protein